MNIANILRAPYTPNRPRGPIDLKLDGNEGLAPPAALLEALTNVETLLRRYPDAAELEALIAERHGVSVDRVLVTAGADDALDRVCRALLGPGDNVVIPVPTFEMLRRYASLAGAELREVNWPAGSAYPREQVIARVDDATKVVCVVSPNNPTGGVADVNDLEALLDTSAMVLVDAAYGEFADADLSARALDADNAVVLRTLSKAWGLAGLRVGYALGPATLIRALRGAGHPYPVAAPSLALAIARLSGDDGDVRRYVDAVRAERDGLARCLRARGVAAPSSQANFVLAQSPRARWLTQGLAGLGIAVRSWPGDRLLGDSARITCPGNAAEARRLEAAIAAVLSPEVLLFDMDGVLADVRGSYRRAIVDTAASYGVPLTARDVAAAKAEGDANNDWIVTHRLLARRGIAVALDEVIARFERLYLGDGDRPGLCEGERLLVDRDRLRELATRIPLGIVTGRPRAQAQAFLDQQGIDDSFSVLIGMEDAPAKPDPGPVQAALAALGVGRAWLVGDTLDDVRAARTAGVVPIGFVAADNERRSESEATLLDAGAARVITRLDELKELLS